MQHTTRKSFDSQNVCPNIPHVTTDILKDGGRFIAARNSLVTGFAPSFDRADFNGQSGLDNGAYSTLLQTQMFGDPNFVAGLGGRHSLGLSSSIQATAEKENLLDVNLSPFNAPFSKETVETDTRPIPKVPFKVLDAPQLQDDFYLNLVDWSSLDILSVCLGSAVYLWKASSGTVSKLCDFNASLATSVAWAQDGLHIAVGNSQGKTTVYDINRGKEVRQFGGHTARTGSLSWNGTLLSTGSRDKTILHSDMRMPQDFIAKLIGHKQEVCGLKWSFDGSQLASGGNDNTLILWNQQQTTPVHQITKHTAAVKALAWSPHQRGLLASGGGTADRKIRFWNTITNTELSCVETQSQVCNLMFAKNCNELISTHGYSNNHIILWKYPSMKKVQVLTGHTTRVLYLAMSADGCNIVSGAGDETLRFWSLFPKPESGLNASSTLSMSSFNLR